MTQNKRIKIKMLNIAFINKRFIEDKNNTNDKYNYENYLLDFVNNSKFVQDNNNQKFNIIKSQSNGECDITNKTYSLDFKLFIPQETIENLNNSSSQIVILTDGVTIHCDSKQHGHFTLYNYLGLLNNKNKEDIMRIKKTNFACPKEESIIKKILKQFETNKNLLFFIPIEIIIDENKDFDEQINNTINNFSDYLKGIIEYRNSYIEKDTYFSFIADCYFIILKCKQNKLYYYDKVNIQSSDLYMEIKDITTIW